MLAASEVERRRRHGRFGRLWQGDPLDRALFVLRGLLPDTEARIDEELVWLRLVLSIPPSRPLDSSLPARWQVAEKGWVDDQLGESDEAAAGPVVAHPLSEQVAEREAEMRSRIDEGLRLLSVGEDRHADEADLLRAHIDGLTLAVCLDRLTPAQAVTLLEAYLVGYTARPAPGPDEAPAP